VWIVYEQIVNSGIGADVGSLLDSSKNTGTQKIRYCNYAIKDLKWNQWKLLFGKDKSRLHILLSDVVTKKENESGETMNIFRKLLRSEFGEKRYNGFANFVYRNCGPEDRECKELFDEMYEYCSRFDSERIFSMHVRLNEALHNAFRVGKTYSLVFIIYLAAWFLLMSLNLQTVVLLSAIGAVTVCFALKTFQFLANRCAYVDAKIIETYRVVLEQLIIMRTRE